MTHSSNHSPSANYTRALATLQESLHTGQFSCYSQRNKQKIWYRICNHANQPGKIKALIVAACLVTGLCLSIPTDAQTISFTAQTGVSNPLNGVSGWSFIRPAFVDLDGDGDKDVLIGTYINGMHYFKNTGTSTAPVFAEQTGASNPLNGVSGTLAAPAFVDIDGDGDQDFFFGRSDGTVIYYKNIGTSIAPVFTLQSGALNPLNGIDVGTYSSPAFVDVDGDGDLDVFIGSSTTAISYYKNTGTSTLPVFAQQTGAANPLNAATASTFAVLTFIDLDKDGDWDAFIGTVDGLTRYYANTGTSGAAVFTLQTGAANPLNGVSVGAHSAPAGVDIGGDGKVDLFIGNNGGAVSYYQNTSVLPLQLVDFTGNHHPDYNQLQWKTADEVNTQQFGVEASNNGAGFTTIAAIKAAGGGNNSYSYQDKTAYNNKVYYRLKMMDIDGHFTYSSIIWINSRQTAAVSLYPNPAREVVNISMGNSGTINTIANLYSSNGILLQKILITAPQQQINIHKLAKGSYVLKFADGTVSTFIKE